MAEEAFILLDRKIAREFQKQAVSTKEYPMDFGEMWDLKQELLKLCGLTELEAHNVLIDRNVSDYISKYSGIDRSRLLETKSICI